MHNSSYFFTEEHQLFRDGLRRFLEKEVVPHIDTWEKEGRIPKEIWKKMGAQGYFGLHFSEAYGGSDADFWYSVVFLEELARCYSGGFAIAPTAHLYMASAYLANVGSEFLKQKYLTKAITGEWIASIAITEPSAGSDVANIRTTARKEGDFYIVNGSKIFITNAVYGDFLITVVKTNPEKGTAGVSLLVIDRHAEGVSANKLNKLGWHASDTAELYFDNVKVPVENLIGEEGKGFYYLMGGLQLERLVGAVGAVAGAEFALQHTLQYMSEREAFGRKINQFQVLRHRIADLASQIEATKYFIYHVCRLHNDKQYAVKEASMAKLLATELSDKTMYQCLQMFGGYGYIEDYKIARMFRDSRIGTIGGGTSEIMREIIAKMVVDDVQYQSAMGHSGDSIAANPSNEKASLQDLTLLIGNKLAGNSKKIGNTIKFVFGEQGVLFLDGLNNTVSNDDLQADCTVKIDLSDFKALMGGKLNPMNAMMSGKLQIDGDMSVAMKLQAVFN